MDRDDKSDWPELRLMTSTGIPASNTPGNEAAREPKGNEVGPVYTGLERQYLMIGHVHHTVSGHEAMGSSSAQARRHDMAGQRWAV